MSKKCHFHVFARYLVYIWLQCQNGGWLASSDITADWNSGSFYVIFYVMTGFQRNSEECACQARKRCGCGKRVRFLLLRVSFFRRLCVIVPSTRVFTFPQQRSRCCACIGVVWDWLHLEEAYVGRHGELKTVEKKRLTFSRLRIHKIRSCS